jgi:glutamyl-tRNA reductase
MLVLLGANHRSAPLSVRERLALPEDELCAWLERLAALPEVDEALVVSTCNRFEVMASAPHAAAGLDAIRAFVAAERGVRVDELARYGYHHTGREAARHVFRVTSSLDSMILGEPQITGQVKQGYRHAREAQTTGPILERLIQSALAAAKRVRSETDIARHPVSIASAAVTLARQIFGELCGRSALLVGAGKMAALVATHLATHGVEQVVVTSRTYNRAVTLAERFGGEAVNWEDARGTLRHVDIVVSGTAAPDIVVSREAVQQGMRRRRSGALFLIDIAVPRDIEPSCNELPNVYLYDIDDLQGIVEGNFEGRRRAAELAERMVDDEVDGFDRWQQSLTVAPTIVSLRESLLALGEKEVGRFRGKLGPLTEDQDRVVHELARSIIQKILHRPIRELKASVREGDSARVVRTVGALFGVEPPPPAPQEDVEQPDGDAEAVQEEQTPAARRGPQRVLEGGKEG